MRYSPAITLLGRYSKVLVHTKVCTSMFIAVLSIIAKRYTQPKYLSTNEGIKKTWYVHTMECDSAIKRY